MKAKPVGQSESAAVSSSRMTSTPTQAGMQLKQRRLRPAQASGAKTRLPIWLRVMGSTTPSVTHAPKRDHRKRGSD
jgi:hypothetical protein